MDLITLWSQHPAVRAAAHDLGDGTAVVDTAITVQQIPAPTFDEAQRGAFVAQQFRSWNLADVTIDEIGNVYARRPGTGNGPGVLIAAHLDTVFPAGTDLSIRRVGKRIYGPGIGDNSLGVAGLLHLGRLLQQYNIPNTGDIWLVANVGEEGLGDLRGMWAAVKRLQDQIAVAIALEGCDQGRVLHEAIGVRRYRVSATAAGGHSWQDFGAASAIHALVRVAARLTTLRTTREPRSSFNIGTIQGGSSVNTIAQSASLLLDLRSTSSAGLEALIHQVEQIVSEAQTHERDVVIESQIVGNRPSGSISRNHPLVQLAAAAYRSVGAQVSYDSGSTDANVPLSCGIPAVCVAIGDGEHAHRLDEHIHTERIAAGMRAFLLLALAASSHP
jgi:acetylornithine deacetylase/succinyl-diaminopimelate desuccinylase-like protein